MTYTESDSIEIITLGEILVEIMRPSFGQPLDQPGEFRGPYASGAPAIFAVAAARLGLNTSFVGSVGEDAFGRLLKNRLLAENVDVSGLQVSPGYGTGVAFVAYDDSEGREFVFHIRHAAAGQLDVDSIPEDFFDSVKWLHISGSTIFLNDTYRAACWRAVELTRRAGGKISLDPNLRLELMSLEESRQVIHPFLNVADLLLPTEGEAQLLTGKSDTKLAAQKLSSQPNIIVVSKRGALGCSILAGGECMDIPGYTVDEIDPTGAGDCFSAAFIAGLEAGWSLEKIGRFANAAGALAVTQLGPMEGAPTRNQVEEFYDR
jgi:sugar/nucleoside kinase (ribokinase family)